MIEGLASAIREKGLAATTVSDIVRHARASRETFYQCFEDKNECFIALAEASFDDVLRDVAGAIDPTGRWDEQVDRGIDAFLERVDADRAVTITFANDLPMLGARGAEIRARRNEQYAELFVAMANAPTIAAQVGDASHVTIERALFLVCGVDGVIERASRAGEDVSSLAPMLKDLVRRVLAPVPPS